MVRDSAKLTTYETMFIISSQKIDMIKKICKMKLTYICYFTPLDNL